MVSAAVAAAAHSLAAASCRLAINYVQPMRAVQHKLPKGKKIVLLRVFQAGAACRSACRSTPTPPRASPPRSTVSSCTTGRVCSVDFVFFGAAAAVWLNGLSSPN